MFKYNIYYVHRFGYVTFKNHEEAKEAASKRVEIFGRLLNLDMAEREARRHVHGMNMLLRHKVLCVGIMCRYSIPVLRYV